MATGSLGVPHPKCGKKNAVGHGEKEARSETEHVCIDCREKFTIG